MMAESVQNPEETSLEASSNANRPNPLVPARMRGIAGSQDPAQLSAVARANPARLLKAYELARLAAQLSQDNKAQDILLLDMRKLTSLVDFFVVVTVPSRRQASAIAGQIELEMKKLKESKLSLEESDTGRWTLLDFGDVVIHLFSPEGRDFYNLEDVWGDAPRLDWKDANLKIN
ncbi:MAG: ribosome silencing factor [Planctomycetota bacterium]|nr:MAG: ribosome silencing factor [Planctomycetota bacterium]